MCKTWSIKYTCSHVLVFWLSKCRATFTTQSKPKSDPKPACSAAPLLTFYSTSRCGPCERAEIEKVMEDEIVCLRMAVGFDGADDDDGNASILEAMERQARMQYRLSKMYPLPKKARGLERGQRVTGAERSSLCREVPMEDAMSDHGVNEDGIDDSTAEAKAYCDEWAQGWGDDAGPSPEAAAEIANWMAGNKEEQTEDDNTPFTQDGVFSDPVIKEPEPAYLQPTITRVLDEEGEKGNMSPSIDYRIKPDDRSGKSEIDLCERMRCLRAWVLISS